MRQDRFAARCHAGHASTGKAFLEAPQLGEGEAHRGRRALQQRLFDFVGGEAYFGALWHAADL